MQVVVEVGSGKLEDFVLPNLDASLLRSEALINQANIEPKNCLSSGHVDLWIVEADVNPGGKCLIEISDLIGCEE